MIANIVIDAISELTEIWTEEGVDNKCTNKPERVRTHTNTHKSQSRHIKSKCFSCSDIFFKSSLQRHHAHGHTLTPTDNPYIHPSIHTYIHTYILQHISAWVEH